MKTKILPLNMILLIMGLTFHHGTYAVKHVVHVGNFYFNPSAVTVSVGDTIRWQWDNGIHTTTSGTIPAGADAWDKNITSGSPDFEYPVTMPGSYSYVCTLHATMGMTGTITATGITPTLTVSPSSLTVSPESGTSQFTVVSNTSWTAASNAGWCTVTPSGNGNGNIIVVYSNNSTPQSRTAEISVTVAGLPVQTVTLIQEASTVGISEGDASSYLIFPNPAKSSFMIRYPEERQIPGEISLLDETGQVSALKLNAAGSNTFSIGELPAGIYFVRIKTDAHTIVKRLMIIR